MIVNRLVWRVLTWRTPDTGEPPSRTEGAERAGTLTCCVSIGKVLLPWWSGPRSGSSLPAGGRHALGLCWREHMPASCPEIQLSWPMSPVRVTGTRRLQRRVGFGFSHVLKTKT